MKNKKIATLVALVTVVVLMISATGFFAAMKLSDTFRNKVTGYLAAWNEEENKGKIAYFAGINKVRFKRQVIPGDTLTLKVTFTKEKGGIYFAAVEASVEGQIAVSGEIMCSL